MKNATLEREDYGDQEQNPDFGRAKGEIGSTKGLLGNLESVLKEIGILKQKMQLIGKEVEQVSKLAKGEHTLGQHIDWLSEVIGNVEEVKNLMSKIPQIEANNKVLETANIDN